jgi:peptidoglycan/LPS O-acetylase OafA/YrhL
MQQPTQRIFGLDLVRAAAIAMVLLNHSLMLLLPLRELPVAGYALGKLLALTVPFGLLGVELFFALSGFLIGNILLRSYLAEPVFGSRQLFHFWKMRWMRTLPAYYAVLLLVLLLDHYYLHRGSDWRYFFFLQNFITPHPRSFGEAWSLSIEEWSYLLLGASFFLMRFARNKQRSLLLFLCSYLFCATLLRVVNAADPLYQSFDWGIRKLVLFRLDAVAWGVLVSWACRHYPARIQQAARPMVLLGLSGVILVTGLNYAGTHPDVGFYFSNRAFRFCMDAFLFTLLPAFFAMLLPYAATIRAPRNTRLRHLVTGTSTLSYALYLVHQYLVLGFIDRYVHTDDPMMALPVFGLYLLLTVAAALALHYGVERPFLKRRETLRRQL